ncbi:XRE family transcriptional regulator, master regulator for biofilm formation [Peribacillus simplex]|uniref:XRE family transcriptional regulator, master regulator for biofilm formation n=1 Tax=Peribacillus simplex TaxID=1478 RepID=A0A9X8WHR1_9BACI|nr:helix-turn-helix domain-containing protein [Peribacillus simplex]SIQ21837.1 XRE family transcriptional regulator, master regulator for biofilm formation [Peribacillus simplex]
MIGYRVKSLREERKMSISELSSKSGVAKSYISSLERNLQTNPTILVLEKIAKILCIKVDALLNEQADKGMDEEWLEIMLDVMGAGISKEEMREFIEVRKSNVR